MRYVLVCDSLADTVGKVVLFMAREKCNESSYITRSHNFKSSIDPWNYSGQKDVTINFTEHIAVFRVVKICEIQEKFDTRDLSRFDTSRVICLSMSD